MEIQRAIYFAKVPDLTFVRKNRVVVKLSTVKITI